MVLGTTESQVIMGIVNATSGKISNLYSLEDKATARIDDKKPDYTTYAAILLDSKDSTDGKAYLYTSFLMNE